MKKLLTSWVALLAFALAVAAQQPVPAALRPLLLGMTKAEVLDLLGEPRSCYAADLYRHTDCDIAYRLSRVPWDVYTRKTGANEYEIRIKYFLDKRESRLHPTLRVGGVWFVLDKAKSLTDVLEELDEARELCGGGCRAWQKTPPSRHEGPMVFPESVSAERRGAAELAARGGDPSSSEYSWRPGFQVVAVTGELVAEIQMRPVSPEFEKSMIERFGYISKESITDLGTWRPASASARR